MEEHKSGKVNGIRQIVRLKELLHKWHHVTISPRENSPLHDDSHLAVAGISPSIAKRLLNSQVVCDSDDESCQGPESPPDVPKGYLAIYVGKDLPRRRFIIPTNYLSHQLFKVLLEKAEEEFGFDHCGGLTIPCEIETFKYLINCIDTEIHVKMEHSKTKHPGFTVGESSRREA